MPSRKTENWKYTPISAIAQGSVLKLVTPLESSATQGIATDSYRLKFNNGSLQSLESIDDPALEIMPFAEASETQQAYIKSFLNQSLELTEHPFAALNASTLQDGVLIKIRANSKPAKPIQIIHANVSEGSSSHTRLIVVVETGAKATLIESFEDQPTSASPKQETGKQPGKQLCNTINECFLAENANLTHYVVNAESEQHLHTGGVFVEQQAGSQFKQHNFACGSALKRRDIQVKLLGPNADCKLYGAYLIGGKTHVDYHTAIDHVAPHCTSEEVFKGIVTDNGKGVFNGRIHIHKDAQQSNAEMSNKNLLLTNTAEVNTKPELEIYADDVKCAHGATVGQLDETALFYFQSRGISRADAHRMLSHAFIESVLDEMEISEVHAHIERITATFYDHCQEQA